MHFYACYYGVSKIPLFVEWGSRAVLDLWPSPIVKVLFRSVSCGMSLCAKSNIHGRSGNLFLKHQMSWTESFLCGKYDWYISLGGSSWELGMQLRHLLGTRIWICFAVIFCMVLLDLKIQRLPWSLRFLNSDSNHIPQFARATTCWINHSSMQQEFLKWYLQTRRFDPTWARLGVNFGPTWTNWLQLQPNLAPKWRNLAQVRPMWEQFRRPNPKSSKRPLSLVFSAFFAIGDASFEVMFPYVPHVVSVLDPTWCEAVAKRSQVAAC